MPDSGPHDRYGWQRFRSGQNEHCRTWIALTQSDPLIKLNLNRTQPRSYKGQSKLVINKLGYRAIPISVKLGTFGWVDGWNNTMDST